eukprot:6130592-Alexandrium_andersonii.AAC.1
MRGHADGGWGLELPTVLLQDAFQALHEAGVMGRPLPGRVVGPWVLPEAWLVNAGFADLLAPTPP